MVGGLALSNFIYYYWACKIHQIILWTEEYCPWRSEAWLHLGSVGCPVHLGSVIPTPLLPAPLYHIFSNPAVFSSGKIWSQFRKHFNLITILIHSPIVNNHNFPPSTLDLAFKIWETKSITSISSLFIRGKFGSVSGFWGFDLPKSHFYRYVHVRHFVQRYIVSFPNLPIDNIIDNLLSLAPHQKGLISMLYYHIRNISP